MCNPFDKKAEPEEHRRYQNGFTAGSCRRAAGLKAGGSRRWSQAFRWGYSDGFATGEITL